MDFGSNAKRLPNDHARVEKLHCYNNPVKLLTLNVDSHSEDCYSLNPHDPCWEHFLKQKLDSSLHHLHKDDLFDQTDLRTCACGESEFFDWEEHSA